VPGDSTATGPAFPVLAAPGSPDTRASRTRTYPGPAPYLGEPDGPVRIVFGRQGKPFYISGPNDDPRAVVATLEATVGPGNYDYLAHL
jgi:hypothetical protein